jgi:hypothetical protein
VTKSTNLEYEVFELRLDGDQCMEMEEMDKI